MLPINKTKKLCQFSYDQFASMKWDDIYDACNTPCTGCLEYMNKDKSAYNLAFELT